MKSFITKFIALFMAMVVVISTTSFTIDMRYCDGHLMDTALFTSVDSCNSDIEKAVSEVCCKPKKMCCSHEQIVIDGLDELSQTTFDDLKLNHQYLVFLWTSTYLNPFEGLEENISRFQDYSPPELVKNIQVLHEVYLI